MNIILKAFKLIKSLPKTIYFNFTYLPFNEAIKLPFFIDSSVRLMKCHGKVRLNFVPNLFCVKIGVADMVVIDKRSNRGIWKVEGEVIFNGEMRMVHSCVVNVEKNGLLTFGSGKLFSANVEIICAKKIIFGTNVKVSWNCFLMDTDWHDIVNLQGVVINPDNEISIGDYVWIGNSCTIKKGVSINQWNIIASNSLVTKSIVGEKQIWAGSPVKLIKEEVYRPSMKSNANYYNYR
jgi:acetyltransferase-like isoleucine patch superfamily enzyme